MQGEADYAPAQLGGDRLEQEEPQPNGAAEQLTKTLSVRAGGSGRISRREVGHLDL